MTFPVPRLNLCLLSVTHQHLSLLILKPAKSITAEAVGTFLIQCRKPPASVENGSIMRMSLFKIQGHWQLLGKLLSSWI